MSTIIGSFTNVGSLLSLLMKIGARNISALIEQVKIVGNDELDLKTRVLAAIEAADIVVDFTETQADDLIVDFLKDAAKQDGLWKLVEVVGYLVEGKSIPVGALPEEGLQVGKDGQEKGFIPLPIAIQLAHVIATIIIQIRNNRK